MVMNRVLYRNLPYDPDKDFVLISTMSPGSLVFVAHKSTGATNLQGFVEYARAGTRRA
jgi:tripartite-type tricarboxylate transporter receptor subunit TctC